MSSESGLPNSPNTSPATGVRGPWAVRGINYVRIPAHVANLLQRALAAERIASGPQRRPAYRVTRELLGGALEVGYSPLDLSVCLGISAASIRTRISTGGWLATSTLAELADIGAEQIQHWRSEGLLPNERSAPSGESYFAAADVIWALGLRSRDWPAASR